MNGKNKERFKKCGCCLVVLSAIFFSCGSIAETKSAASTRKIAEKVENDVPETTPKPTKKKRKSTGRASKKFVKTDPLLGTVFPCVEDFLKARIPSFEDDENVRIKADEKREDFVWVYDFTPMHNGAWYLFKKGKNNTVRFILYIPYASTVEVIGGRKFPGLLAKERTPGFPRPSKLFKYNAELKFYVPSVCKEEYWDIPKGEHTDEALEKLYETLPVKTRLVDCVKAYDDFDFETISLP